VGCFLGSGGKREGTGGEREGEEELISNANERKKDLEDVFSSFHHEIRSRRCWSEIKTITIKSS